MAIIDIENSCKKGKIGIEDFFEFIAWKIPRRTHFLDVGDYVVMAHPYRPDHVDIEKIAELNFPEKGDFITNKGTMGPISGNVFIKPNNKRYTAHLLIEGDRIGEPTCPALVYKAINNYLKKWCRLN